jgi:hypothetical protein
MPLSGEEKIKLKGLVEDIADLGARFQLGTVGIVVGLRGVAISEIDKWTDSMQKMIKDYKELRRKAVPEVVSIPENG